MDETFRKKIYKFIQVLWFGFLSLFLAYLTKVVGICHIKFGFMGYYALIYISEELYSIRARFVKFILTFY